MDNVGRAVDNVNRAEFGISGQCVRRAEIGVSSLFFIFFLL